VIVEIVNASLTRWQIINDRCLNFIDFSIERKSMCQLPDFKVFEAGEFQISFSPLSGLSGLFGLFRSFGPLIR